MKIALIGAGLIGQSIAHLLRETGDYDVVVFDRDAHALELLEAQGISTRRVDSADANALRLALQGFDALLNAMPYYLAVTVATAAKAAGVHYFDLTEDVRATHAIRAIADNSSHAFMPQCGLAPGFIGIVAHDLAKRFAEVREVKMRVGALPEFPTNALKYNLTWSIDGLINEYCQPCEAIRDGSTQWVQPLEGLEHFSLDGTEYEAFNTSGGLGTLCETLAGKVETLDYKSVRYPGHRELMKFLLDDLRMSSDRDGLKAMLRRAVPATAQDVVLVFVTFSAEPRSRVPVPVKLMALTPSMVRASFTPMVYVFAMEAPRLPACRPPLIFKVPTPRGPLLMPALLPPLQLLPLPLQELAPKLKIPWVTVVPPL